MLCVVMVVCFDAVSAAITPKIVFYWLGVMIVDSTIKCNTVVQR